MAGFPGIIAQPRTDDCPARLTHVPACHVGVDVDFDVDVAAARTAASCVYVLRVPEGGLVHPAEPLVQCACMVPVMPTAGRSPWFEHQKRY